MTNIDFRLYLITDRRLGDASLLTAVRQALDGGVRAVQLREKDLMAGELLKLAYKIRRLTERYNARLFINSRFDLALAAGADGVHLTQSGMPVDVVRGIVKKRLMIGVSTHSLKEARRAETGGADFITFGPVYRTASKAQYGAPVGLERLGEVSEKVKIPVFALGGVNIERCRKTMAAGVHGVSMISGIFGADDVKNKAEAVLIALEGKGKTNMAKGC
ncbi:thiamine phosphate synthase [bacterium]|nr:thiamine phosphate synthase [bacterium]